MRHSRITRFSVGLIACALVAAACGDSDDGGSAATTTVAGPAATAAPATTIETPVAGGTATIILPNEIATLDPVKSNPSAGASGQKMYVLYGALVGYDVVKNVVTPILAESLKPKGTDFATWTLKLRSGIKFSDGTAMTATSVKVNWERDADPANACSCRGLAATIKSMTVVDTQTLDIALATPNAHFDKGVEAVALNYIASDKAIADKVDMSSKAVGAGPFLLEQWIRDDRMIVNKNPDWVLKPGPYLDKITFRVSVVEDQKVDAFITNQADAFYTTTASSITKGTKDVKDAYFAGVSLSTGQSYTMNNTAAPFNDARIRMAFASGIDFTVIPKDILGGADPGDTYSPPKGTAFYNAKSAVPKLDPANAQKLIDAYIAEKNGGQPLKITLQASNNSLDQTRSKYVQTAFGQLKNVSIEIVTNDQASLISKVTGGNYQVSSWGFPILEPEPGLFNYTHSGLPTNYSRYSNPEVDKALEAARLTTDQTERKRQYDIVTETLAKDVPFLPYTVTRQGWVTVSKLRGATVYTDGILRYDLLWLKK